MATRLHRPGLEPESRRDCGVAVKAVVRMAHEHVERLGVRALHAAERILTLGDTQPLESARTIASSRSVDGVERV
jgi:hypothetical protein